MVKFILGLILGIVLAPLFVVLYLVSGYAPAAASDPPMPFETTIAKTALHKKIESEMPKSVPIQVTDATYVDGVRVYKMECAMCHGLPDKPAPDVAQGMFPHAPQLFQPHHMVTDDPPGETYWKAKNGIRLTGMPGFSKTLKDDELWAVSVMLANADKLPAAARQELGGQPK